LIVAALLICLIPATAHAVLAPYSQDFELLIPSDLAALGADNWLVFGNVFAPDGTTYLYGYGTFAAPNDGSGFCQIVMNEGGLDQGLQQLVIFSDYNNGDHGDGKFIEANVFQEQIVGPDNVGQRWVFDFDAKLGNLEGVSTAAAFIKTLDPGAGYALTNFITADMTTTPGTWTGYSLAIDIDASLDGQILQIGFLCTATLYEGSGVFYDNLDFREDAITAAPPSVATRGMTLSQNFPNPFNPNTRITFSLDQPGNVELAVYDLAGRRISTLQQGGMGSGEQTVVWDGRTDDGALVASGHYRYVLRTAQGQLSRGMTLLK
jgi:hypothetical protein